MTPTVHRRTGPRFTVTRRKVAVLTLGAALPVLTACLPAPPKPLLPPLIQEGPCAHTTDMRNRARCVIFTSTRKPGYWLQDAAYMAYFEVGHGTAKIVKDPS